MADRETCFKSAGVSTNAPTHLTVPGGENGSEDLPVLLHLIKLPLQGTLHVGIGQHVFYDVFLQHAPQRSLVGAVELKPRWIKKKVTGGL